MKPQIKHYAVLFLIFFCSASTFSQTATSEWKAQLALGVNSPSSTGFVEPFEAKPINFPTVNIGIQHMFKEQMGAKLDFGFNRFSNTSDSPDFKVNYTRINAQFVFDATKSLTFLPQRIGIVGHAGPGYTFVKPLEGFSQNKISFLNAMGGIEFHYGISQTISLFTDVSYIYSFAKDFDPPTDGLGSFNGNLTTITFGISFSLSGCYYCD